MDIQTEIIDNATVVRLSGSLDRPGRDALVEQVLTLLETNRQLVIDLSGVDFISSAGLLFLLDLNQKCMQEGVRLALTAPSFTVREIISMVGLMESPLPIYDTLEQGLERSRTRGFPADRKEEESASAYSPKAPEPSFSIPKMVEEEDVNFSAYHPKEVTVDKWYTLLV